MTFSHRNIALREQMESPECDLAALTATYHQFSRMNRLVSGWYRLYRRWLLPVFRTLKEPVTVLDAGCGGGDIPYRLVRWAQRDGIDLSILALDTDPRAIAFAQQYHAHPKITYRVGDVHALRHEGALFNVILSNHVLHHLDDESLTEFLTSTEALASQLVLHSDIRRSLVAYALFRVFMPFLFRHSYTVDDGLTSIRRSFDTAELARLLPRGWSVHTMTPWRLLAVKKMEAR